MAVSGGQGTRRLLLAMALASGITSVPSGAIVLALLLIRADPKVQPLPRPNVTEPFSGLAPRP
jgi:hypothetical protein